jgi:GNAT superfamily N-acetyltransferase
MDVQIEIARREDLTEILNLQKESYKTEAELHNEFNIPPLTQSQESVNEEFDTGWLFLKIIINDAIVASGRGITKRDTTHIAKLSVKKEFQNQKLGQKILKELESRLSDCKRYELYTGYKSERNLYIYNKLGYKEFNRQFINDNLTLVYLEKENVD